MCLNKRNRSTYASKLWWIHLSTSHFHYCDLTIITDDKGEIQPAKPWFIAQWLSAKNPCLIAKLIVDYDWIGNVIDYDYISFLVSSIDCDHSKNCNRLRLAITITPCLLTKNTISFFFTPSSIRSTSPYNVTLFLSISMIFLHSSAIACSSSDNSTCVGFTVTCQKMLIHMTFKTEYSKYGEKKEQRKQWDTSIIKYVLSTMGVSKESISKFLIGNRFHVKLRIILILRGCNNPHLPPIEGLMCASWSQHRCRLSQTYLAHLSIARALLLLQDVAFTTYLIPCR